VGVIDKNLSVTQYFYSFLVLLLGTLIAGMADREIGVPGGRDGR
jgi:hypothetical protein